METSITRKQLLREAFDASTAGKIIKRAEWAVGGALTALAGIFFINVFGSKGFPPENVTWVITICAIAAYVVGMQSPSPSMFSRIFSPNSISVEKYKDRETRRLDREIKEARKSIGNHEKRIEELERKKNDLLAL